MCTAQCTQMPRRVWKRVCGYKCRGRGCFWTGKSCVQCQTPSPTQGPLVSQGSPSGIPPWFPLDSDMFRPVPLSPCEVPEPRAGYPLYRYEGWNSSLPDCLKECQFDDFCQFVLWREGQCIKLELLETTDDPLGPWGGWGAFVKNTFIGVIPYLSGKCAGYKGINSCLTGAPDCAWNQGKKGYNQMADWTNGYCGRVKC